MAAAIVQHPTSRDTAATAHTTTISAATAGNLLLGYVGIDKDAGAAITVPTGFTRIGTDFTDASVSFAYAYKIAAGGETSVQWTWSTSQTSSAGVIEISGLTASPFDVNAATAYSDSAVTSRSTNTTATLAQADSFCVAFAVADTWNNIELGRAWTNSFVELDFDTGTGSSRPGISVATKTVAATTGVESTFSTTDTGDQIIGVIAAFKVAGAAGSVVPALMGQYRERRS